MKMKGRKNYRFMLLLISILGCSATAMPGVIITGLLHGTLAGGAPKAIELFITGTEDLSNYQVWRSVNGAAFGAGSGSIATMSGVYSNTFVYLVKNDQLAAFEAVFGNEGIYANVVAMGIINGNGNEGFQVRLAATSAVIDQVWKEDAADSYRDSYWYRRHGTGPDGGWVQSSWETPGNDALDGLDAAGIRAAVPFGSYAVAWQGLSEDWNLTGNWTSGAIPSHHTNLLITDTVAYFPVVDNPPENPAVCMNLTLLDTAGLTVSPGKALTVYGNLTWMSQERTTPGNGIHLASATDEAVTGSLIVHGITACSATIERYIPKDNSWHFLSSPIEQQFFNPVFVPDLPDQSFDLYYWDEGALWEQGWINIRNDDGSWNPQFGDAFIPGRGYLIAYAPSNSGEDIRTFSGMLYAGEHAISVQHSGNHWNLLGNPYPSALDWSSGGIDKSSAGGWAMYIWDPLLNDHLGGYRMHNGTDGVPAGTTPIIPSMQGFFVESLEEGFLQIDPLNDSPLLHHPQAAYKSAIYATTERLRLKISKEMLSDEIMIGINPYATNEYDPSLDAHKLFNGHCEVPEIYLLAEAGHRVCLNMIGDIPVSIPLGVVYPETDTLTLSVFDDEGLSPEVGIYLEDKQEGLWVNLREGAGYRYCHQPYQMGERFMLHLMNAAYQPVAAMKPAIDCWHHDGRIYISNPESRQGVLVFFTLDGRIAGKWDVSPGTRVIQHGIAPGAYVWQYTSPGATAGKLILIH